MSTVSTPAEAGAGIAELFDQLADGYDRAALRFFPFAADRLAQRLAPRAGEKIIDVATGTGAVAVAVGQRLGGGGRVMAVDISERMLDRAYANVRRMGLHNVDLHPMDAASLEFRDAYFDALTCSFGLFFLPDMDASLREWRRVLKPGARVLLTGFGASLFEPCIDLFRAQLADAAGVEVDPARDFAWLRLSRPEHIQPLLEGAGFGNVRISSEQFGYHLQSTDEWWDVVWNTGLRMCLKSLDADTLDRFKRDHLTALAEQFSDGQLWLDVPVQFISAELPN